MKKGVLAFISLLCVALLLSGCETAVMERFGYTSSVIVSVDYSAVSSDESACINPIDLFTDEQIVQTCVNLCDSGKVLERVKEISGISDGFTMKAEAIHDSNLIEISVSSWDEQTAYDVCVAYAEVVPEMIPEIIVGSSVKVIEYPQMPA